MKHFRQRQYFLALFAMLALLAIFAGCKGESSPTAPAPTSGNPGAPAGGTTPPSGATIVLTTSNASPLVNSTSVITATVTQSGTAVVNGTAVEFSTNLGTFADSGTATTIRTTTNGVATATLSATAPGTATVTAVVNNVNQKTQVTFSALPVVPPPVPPPVPPNTSPTVTGVTPATGRPQGGETITINGTNFRAPVRVLFDFGNGLAPKEAFVVSVTSTQITALTPSVDLGTGQQKQATIIVIVEAGTTSEQKFTQTNAFTFQAQVLTPRITTVSPASGPIDGGTRITVFGDGFQAPVQVFFGAAEAQVISINFNQLVVISPTARDTLPGGSGTPGAVGTGPVDIRVININSATTATLTAGFRYIAKMQITAITPTFGSALGGTDVRIDGIGFNDPVTVDIGGVRAQTIRVSATEILARTGATASPCAPGSITVVTVTNVDNGDTAVSPQNFVYVAVPPVITGVIVSSPPLTIGGAVNVNVLNPGVGQLGTAFVGFNIGDKPAAVTPNQISSGTGTQSFSVIVPPTITFPSVSCTPGAGLIGTQLGPVTLPITFNNQTDSCTTTQPNAVTINPPGANPCVVPAAAASVTAPANGACAAAGSVAVGSTASTAITIANTAAAGGTPLNLSVTTAGAGFSVSPSAQTVNAGQSRTFVVTFTPASTGAKSGTATFTTNDPNNPTITVCLTGTGT